MQSRVQSIAYSDHTSKNKCQELIAFWQFVFCSALLSITRVAVETNDWIFPFAKKFFAFHILKCFPDIRNVWIFVYKKRAKDADLSINSGNGGDSRVSALTDQLSPEKSNVYRSLRSELTFKSGLHKVVLSFCERVNAKMHFSEIYRNYNSLFDSSFEH